MEWVRKPEDAYYFSCFVFLSAYIFFLFLFPRTKSAESPTPEKLKRNKIYRVWGIVMLFAIIEVGIQMLFLENISPFDRYLFILTFEWVALWALGISWIVKGEMFLEDK